MRTSYRHEEVILQEPVTLSIIGASVIGAGSAAYQANEAKDAAKKAEEERKKLADIEKARLDQIARDTKPMEEGATVEYGAEDTGEAVGSYDDFMVSKGTTSSLGTSNKNSGLSSLGM